MSCKAFFSGKSPYITSRLGKCLIEVGIHCLLYLNLAFFMNYAIFLKLCDRMRFEVNCLKSHHHVISDGLTRMAWKTRITSVAKGRLG